MCFPLSGLLNSKTAALEKRKLLLFADKNALKIICYLYSLSVIPVAASLIGNHTRLSEKRVEEYMECIFDSHLATRTTIATTEEDVLICHLPVGFCRTVALLCRRDRRMCTRFSECTKKPFF